MFERLLFDVDTSAANQSPDADDAYVAFIGAHLVTPAVIHAEETRVVNEGDARSTDALLYLRALELAEILSVYNLNWGVVKKSS